MRSMCMVTILGYNKVPASFTILDVCLAEGISQPLKEQLHITLRNAVRRKMLIIVGKSNKQAKIATLILHTKSEHPRLTVTGTTIRTFTTRINLSGLCIHWACTVHTMSNMPLIQISTSHKTTTTKTATTTTKTTEFLHKIKIF